MVSYKYNPDPKWRVSYFNKENEKLQVKEFRSYTEISHDNEWNKIIRNKDHFHNVFKRLKNTYKNKNIVIVKLR